MPTVVFRADERMRHVVTLRVRRAREGERQHCGPHATTGILPVLSLDHNYFGTVRCNSSAATLIDFVAHYVV